MALAKQYQSFRADLGGYAEVPISEFRERLAPLRRQKEWSSAEAEYVRDLALRGGAYALQQLFGPRHPAASAVLGSAALTPEPLSKPELEHHLAALMRCCATDGWPARRYEAYARYLASDLAPADLAGRGAPAQDTFAGMYRGAGPSFRRIVEGHLAGAAERARTAESARAPSGTAHSEGGPTSRSAEEARTATAGESAGETDAGATGAEAADAEAACENALEASLLSIFGRPGGASGAASGQNPRA